MSLLTETLCCIHIWCVAVYLKKTEVELELLTDADMLLMVKKGIRGGKCYATNRCAKAINKYIEGQTQNHHISCSEISTIYIDKQCNNSCLWMVSGGKGKSFDDDSNLYPLVWCYLSHGIKIDSDRLKIDSDLPFLPEKINIGIFQNLSVISLTRRTMSYL